MLRYPQYNVLKSPGRKLNYQFSVAEWLWIMLGYNAAEVILPYNKNLAEFQNELTGTFDGAYGPHVVMQLPYVLQKLQEDPDTRQAIISLWQPRPRASKDIPCTISLQFILRNDQLHMVATMRSNDAWLGMPYDIFNFTQIQNYVAALLDVGMGEYHHVVGSLHLYERDWAKAKTVADEESVMHLVTDQTHSPPLTRMPGTFKSFFYGMSVMGGIARNSGMASHLSDFEIKRWVEPNIRGFDRVWGGYLKLLATRFMHDWHEDWLEYPYNTLVFPKHKHPLDSLVSTREQFNSTDPKERLQKLIDRQAENEKEQE